MSALRPLTLAVVSALGAVLLFAPACGTDAVGVEECRSIESARCEAAPACKGANFDVDQCRLFYRDHCLHGLRLEDAPSQRTIDGCVLALRRAASCARSTGAETPVSSCPEDAQPLTQLDAEPLTACGVVDRPDRLVECAFLVPSAEPPVTPTPDAGGGGGGSSGNGGSSGSAGADAD